MDFFEFNKIAGAVLASLLVILSIDMFLVPALYHAEKPAKKAYIVEGLEAAGGTGGAAEEAPAEKPLELLIAEASPAKGERIAKRCTSCHSFEQGGPHKIGPNLWNVMGQKIARHPDFNYSEALKSIDGIWDWATMDKFLEDPKGFAPGTLMSFAGLKKAEDRAAVMVYLATLAPEPYPKPPVSEAGAE